MHVSIWHGKYIFTEVTLNPSLQLVPQLCRKKEEQSTNDTYFQTQFFEWQRLQ